MENRFACSRRWWWGKCWTGVHQTHAHLLQRMPAQQCLRHRNKTFATEHTATRQFVNTRVTSRTNTMVVHFLGTAIVQCKAVQCAVLYESYESYLFHFPIRARASPSNPKLQAHPTCWSHCCSHRRCRHPESSTLPTRGVEGDVAKHACNHLCIKANLETYSSKRSPLSSMAAPAYTETARHAA